MPTFPKHLEHLAHVGAIANVDAAVVTVTDTEYNASWKQRGGAGAFFVLARKWDRLEQRVRAGGYDIFATVAKDERTEGAIDDIRDLRRYLLLVEAALLVEGTCPGLTGRDRDALAQLDRMVPDAYRADPNASRRTGEAWINAPAERQPGLTVAPRTDQEPFDTRKGDPPPDAYDRRLERLAAMLEARRAHGTPPSEWWGEAVHYNQTFSYPLSDAYLESWFSAWETVQRRTPW